MQVQERAMDRPVVSHDFHLEKSDHTPFKVLQAGSLNLAKNAAQELKKRGCVILRGIISEKSLSTIQERVRQVTEQPSIGGSFGFYMKDSAKKFCDPLVLCEEAVQAIVDERMLDCMKEATGEEMILAEAFMKQDLGVNDVYFPLHADFCVNGKWGGNARYVTPFEILQKPFAIGGIIYLHDTSEGAFCFSEGTQNWGAPIGTSLSVYPKEIQDKVHGNLIRVDGKAGDIVLFDDRGFHGPEQPTTAMRTVIIFDYTSVSTFGRAVKCAPPVLIPYLRNLSKRQLDSLGWGCDINIPYEENHVRNFSQHPNYKILAFIYQALFSLERLKIQLRNAIKGHKPNSFSVKK